MIRGCFGKFVVLAFLLILSNSALAATSVPGGVLRMPTPSHEAGPLPQAQPMPQYQVLPLDPSAMPSVNGQEYILGTGDRIKLTVYGEADLSGEYDVGSTGFIALPLIGDIKASNKSLREFELAVRAKLQDGYLKDPRVSAQVMNYRPFFILGEVSKPGGYPFVNGMTVVNAVALAGGYTYRGDKSEMTIVRANDQTKKPQRITEDAAVLPGDIIRVPERFF